MSNKYKESEKIFELEDGIECEIADAIFHSVILNNMNA